MEGIGAFPPEIRPTASNSLQVSVVGLGFRVRGVWFYEIYVFPEFTGLRVLQILRAVRVVGDHGGHQRAGKRMARSCKGGVRTSMAFDK